MKISLNAPCPCGSQKKYKKCCKIFHNGALAPTALLLMKSRYSAFATNDYAYIIKTTHPQNSDFMSDKKAWKASILEFIDGQTQAYVTFKANLMQNGNDSSFIEKSNFIKEDKQWLYHSGEFIS